MPALCPFRPLRGLLGYQGLPHWTQQTSDVVRACGQSCFEDSLDACPEAGGGGPLALGVRLCAVAPPHAGQGAFTRGLATGASGRAANERA